MEGRGGAPPGSGEADGGVVARVGRRALLELARGLLGLPAPLKRLLSGGRPIRRDGLTLDAEIQLLLALLGRLGHRSFDQMSPAEARAEVESLAQGFSGGAPPLARVEDRSIPGPAGALSVRHYVPDGARHPGPLVVYYHGGGWVVGSLASHDATCRYLASEAGIPVLAVDYRLAPEHRFPAAMEDALAALRWAAAEHALLGVDPARIAVAGDSAGGNLAAAVARLARREGGPRPAFQLLLYPVTDLSAKQPSYRLFPEGFFLTAGEMDWYRGHYLPDESAARDPRASPLLAGDLAGLPPALVVTAGFDVLRDEGEAYARALERAGVLVRLERHAGLIHGFANMFAVSRSCRAAMRAAATALARALADTAESPSGRRPR
jgi:acetyl esterase